MSRDRGASAGPVPQSPVSSQTTRDPWPGIRAELRSRGLRWTPQRKLILDVLGATRGHVTGSEIVERCRTREPETTPSTVYRTLAVLEDLGYLHHSHAADGREEFHVLPSDEHGHLRCIGCGQTWEVAADEAETLVAAVAAARRFSVDLSHLSIVGRCAACQAADAVVAEG
jgi:Fur family ferric uptake transcriptional regulator